MLSDLLNMRKNVLPTATLILVIGACLKYPVDIPRGLCLCLFAEQEQFTWAGYEKPYFLLHLSDAGGATLRPEGEFKGTCE